MPKLAAFPKAWMDPLCIDGSMTVREWIEYYLSPKRPWRFNKRTKLMFGYIADKLTKENSNSFFNN